MNNMCTLGEFLAIIKILEFDKNNNGQKSLGIRSTIVPLTKNTIDFINTTCLIRILKSALRVLDESRIF